MHHGMVVANFNRYEFIVLIPFSNIYILNII
jgi:hypothetical protein